MKRFNLEFGSQELACRNQNRPDLHTLSIKTHSSRRSHSEMWTKYSVNLLKKVVNICANKFKKYLK
jgi:hypothetical protein